MISVQYLFVGAGFALFVVLMVKEGPSMREAAQPLQLNTVFSDRTKSFWHPAVRQRVLKVLAVACVVLFTVRTLLLVCASLSSDSPIWVESFFVLVYYVVLEVVPYLAICLVFSWTPKIYTLRDYSAFFMEFATPRSSTSTNSGNDSNSLFLD